MNVVLLAALLAVSVESRIDSVIVYADQAMVIRKSVVELSGSGELTFSNLTGMLDDNSVRIKAPGLHIGEVKVKPGYIAEPTGRVKQLQDSLERLQQQDRAYNDEADVGKAKETFLNSIKLGAPELMSKELAAGKVDAGSWDSGLNFLATELVAVKKRTAELERIRKELSKTIAAVTQELSAARAAWENRKAIVIDAVAEQSGSYLVTLTYLVPYSVSWSPYYELRAMPSDQSVQISYYARLSQRTNEDWSSVRTILSTARPSAGVVAPEPLAWYLDIWAPRYGEGKATRGMLAAPRVSADMMAEEQEVAGQAAQAPPPVETGISLRYVIPGLVSLKSGEDPKKLFIYETSLPAEFSYYTYPRAQEISYLRGKLQNGSDFIFLAGQGNTYVGDEFTGKTYLPNVAPGESVNASFGVDDRVKVKRELLKTLTSKTGLLGNRTRVDFVYRTTVENYHSKLAQLTLVEQIPVSQNKDIKVGVEKLDPKPAEENHDNGTFTLKTELKPQDKFTVNLAYYVEYPTGRRVSGLY